MSRASIDYCVLDALANDLESIDDILRLMNSETIGWREYNGGRDFERIDVVLALSRCVHDRLVDIYPLAPSGKELMKLPEGVLPASGFDDCWFGLTGAGRLQHSNWNPGLAGDEHRAPPA